MPSREVVVKVSAVNNFTPTLDRYQREIQGARRGTDEFGRSAQRTGGMLDGLGGAIAGSIAALGVMGVAQLGGQMLELGTNTGIVTANFDALTSTIGGGEATLRMMQEATGGVISEIDLMVAANKLLGTSAAENARELADLTGAAVRLGAAVGEGPVESIDRLNQALANNSYELLDQLSISASTARARVKELTDQGVEMSEAFRIATLEGADTSLARLGDSANAAFAPLDRLTARAQDFAAAMSGDFSAGIQGGINLMNAWMDRNDAISAELENAARISEIASALMSPETLAQNMVAMSGGSAIFAGELNVFETLTTAAETFEETMGRAVQTTEDLRNGLSLMGLPGSFLDDFSQQGNMFLASRTSATEQARRLDYLRTVTLSAIDDIGNRINSLPTISEAISIGAGNLTAASQRSAQVAGFNSAYDMIDRLYASAGPIGDSLQTAPGIISPEDLALLEYAADYTEVMYQSMVEMSETDPIDDAALERARVYSQQLRAAADSAAEIRTEFETSTLSERLGETSVDPRSAMGRFDALADIAIGSAELSPEELRQVQDQIGLLTGELTGLSITIRDQVAPAIGDMFEEGQITAGLTLLESVTAELDRMAESGMSVVEMDTRLSDALSAGYGAPVVRAGGIPVSMGTYDRGAEPAEFDPAAFSDSLGLGAESMTLMSDESITLAESMQIIAPGVTDMASVLPDVVEGFTAMSGQTTIAKDDVTLIKDDLTALAASVQRIRVNVEPTAPAWFIAAMSSGSGAALTFLENSVSANGGNVPGSINR